MENAKATVESSGEGGAEGTVIADGREWSWEHSDGTNEGMGGEYTDVWHFDSEGQLVVAMDVLDVDNLCAIYEAIESAVQV